MQDSTSEVGNVDLLGIDANNIIALLSWSSTLCLDINGRGIDVCDYPSISVNRGPWLDLEHLEDFHPDLARIGNKGTQDGLFLTGFP